MSQKDKTEQLLESYFQQRRMPYEYEPFNDGGKNPDYLVTHRGKKILFEVKEIKETPFDKVIESLGPRGGTFNLDPKDLSKLLRRRIYDASKQLKPHKDEVDYCVVILGAKNNYSDLGLDEVFYAMFGDLFLSIPFDPIKGGSMAKASSDLKATGALRKNQPKTKEMYSPHRYISAVGVVRSFNGRLYYESSFYDKILKGRDTKNWTPHQLHDFLKREWSKHSKNVPKIYSDPKKTLYKIQIISNPLGDKPLDRGIFNGRWDHVRFPKVIYKD